MSIRVIRGVAVLAMCASWACAKKDTAADSVAAADSAAKAAAAAAPPAPPPPAPLNDANIVALLDEANAGDSTMGHLASTKGSVVVVKGFGRDMMRDHHALRKAGQDLAKKINVTPAPPANDTLPAAAQRAYDAMNSMPAGPEWDKAYIAGEVAAHQGVLALLQTAQTAAGDTTLKALIVKAIPTIEAHLKKAQDVQTKLSSAPTADSGKKK